MSLAATFRRSVVRSAPRIVRPQTRLPISSARAYSTGGSAPSGGTSWFALLAAAGLGAVAGGFGASALGGDSLREAGSAARSAAQSGKAATGFIPSRADYQKVYNRIAEILDANDYDDGSYGPVLLRLAWHSSGTYDKDTKTGGSNYATMRFEPESIHAANNGLNVARAKMEEIKNEFPWLSYGDLWTLGGVVALQEMDGPKIPWRPGRIDGFAKDATPDGRLPDATQGSDHLRNWQWRKWDGPKQLEDKTTKSLMMLPTDMALVQDKKFRPWVQKYADDQDLFFKDFSEVIVRLFELGVPPAQFGETILFKKTEEQK
ncbi:heme peroxidase [Ceratobasidium sp. 423]|nr:heme peroxidase [Ceratobasidium sp. 423]